MFILGAYFPIIIIIISGLLCAVYALLFKHINVVLKEKRRLWRSNILFLFLVIYSVFLWRHTSETFVVSIQVIQKL